MALQFPSITLCFSRDFEDQGKYCSLERSEANTYYFKTLKPQNLLFAVRQSPVQIFLSSFQIPCSTNIAALKPRDVKQRFKAPANKVEPGRADQGDRPGVCISQSVSGCADKLQQAALQAAATSRSWLCFRCRSLSSLQSVFKDLCPKESQAFPCGSFSGDLPSHSRALFSTGSSTFLSFLCKLSKDQLPRGPVPAENHNQRKIIQLQDNVNLYFLLSSNALRDYIDIYFF